MQSKEKCCNRLIVSTLEGCPDGLEPSTFRTTIHTENSSASQIFKGLASIFKNPFCADFAPILRFCAD